MRQTQRNDPCPCGSGKKYKKCCMGKNERSPIIPKLRSVTIGLIAILVFGAFLRIYGFQKPHKLTFDEGLYAELIAPQLNADLTNYSTQEAYRYQTGLGERIPIYLDRPLFKHPPLYSYLIAINYKIFGSSHMTAVSVSVFFGVLMIWITFLIGRELYDDRVGLLAAVLMCFDPVHWICSEKIWMETTMSFFFLSSTYLFVLGWKNKKLMVLSGISAGLAMLTKYPGALALITIGAFVIIFDRSMFKKKEFWGLCAASLIIFSPWIFWNMRVYDNMFDAFLSVHYFDTYWKSITSVFSRSKGVLFGAAVAGVALYLFRSRLSLIGKQHSGKISLAAILIALAVLPFFRGIVAGIFTFKETVLVGWANPFVNGPWHFYLTRLCELSPFYLFSYISLFFMFGTHKGDRLIILSSALILGAFIFLGSYQSRYVLPAVPFLLLLSARGQVWAYDRLSHSRTADIATSSKSAYNTLIRLFLMGVCFYFLFKTLRTDWLIAIGPDFGYF